MIGGHLPALQVAVPLLGAVLCALVRRGTAAWLIALAVAWTMPVIAGFLLHEVLTGGTVSYHLGGWPPPIGIEYRVDVLNAFVLMLVAAVGAVVVPFARRSIAAEIAENKQAWFYCMFLLCLGGLLGIAITGDAFNIFVFLEISSLSSYVMIALGHDRRALLAAFQYLVMGTIGATFYVVGVGLIYTMTGSLNLADISTIIGGLEHPRPVFAALAFITVGISLKLALFPLHAWLPNAYTYAPSVATAFLAATATKVAVYLFLRYAFTVFDLRFELTGLPIFQVLLALSIAAMFGPSIVAIFQNDVKRMLAYSSVAQIGYITLGIAMASTLGLTAAIVHLFNHAVMKGALFLALGAVFFRIRSVRIDDLAGIGRTMPLTMAAFVIAGMSMVGVPGTVGFVSKWYLIVAAIEIGWWWLAVLVVLSSLIAVFYIGRVVEVAWFRAPVGAARKAADPPAEMMLPIAVLTAAAIWFGIDTELTAGVAAIAADALLASPP